MADITLDTSTHTGSVSADDTPAVVVNSNPNRLMLLLLSYYGDHGATPPNWQGDDMSKITADKHTADDPSIVGWYLTAPAVASADLAINDSGAVERAGFVTVWYNVDPNDPIVDADAGDEGSASLTGMTAIDMAVHLYSDRTSTNNWQTATRGAGQTAIFDNHHTRIAEATGSRALQSDLSYELGESSPSASGFSFGNYMAVGLRGLPPAGNSFFIWGFQDMREKWDEIFSPRPGKVEDDGLWKPTPQILTPSAAQIQKLAA